MRIGKKHKKHAEEAELDITSFMNLMIVLVPVLLMMMVFTRITVVELTLPGIASTASSDEIKQEKLEVLVTPSSLDVFFPQGYLVQSIPAVTSSQQESGSSQYDYAALQAVLKQVKQTLLNKGVDKKDITLLLPLDLDYQSIVSLIDTTRSYKEVLVTSVVDAELFPDVSLADAPVTLATMATSPDTAGGAL